MLGPPKERVLDRPILVSLEALVPADHFYRHLEAKLDLSFVRELVADRYAPGGRPSVDPVVFFKLQLVMFFEGIRSERKLIETAALHLAQRWYLGFNFDEPLPDHSSLTRIRDRYGLETFRRFFEAIVEQCQEAGLVWGKELYFDSTKVDANASMASLRPRFAIEPHLEKLFEPGQEEETSGPSTTRTTAAVGPPALPSASGAADHSNADPAPLSPPVPLSDGERRALAEANAARHDWLARDGQPDRSVRESSYRRRNDFVGSATDPDAALMERKGGVHFGYRDHYVVDGGKGRIILDALVVPGDVMDNTPMLDLLWHTRARWKIHPKQVTGDTRYGTIENIVPIEDAGIKAYLALPDLDARTPLYGPSLFRFDPEHDAYRCPQDRPLRRLSVKYTEEVVAYRAAADDCNACPVKAACTTGENGRTIQRSFYVDDVERVQAYRATTTYQKAMAKRQVWVEPLFAEAKDWHGLRRFRLRRLRKVNGIGLVTASGQNLKRLLSRRGWGRRPWPSGAPGLRLGPETWLCA